MNLDLADEAMAPVREGTGVLFHVTLRAVFGKRPQFACQFEKSQRGCEWIHFAAASFAPSSIPSEQAMRRNAEPDWDAVPKATAMLRRGRSASRRPTMRKAIFAALAVLGFSLATTALAPTANASNPYPNPPNPNSDGQ